MLKLMLHSYKQESILPSQQDNLYRLQQQAKQHCDESNTAVDT